MALFMTDEIATSFNLKQVTTTVEDSTYWAEHICTANENTARFVNIKIGTRELVGPSDSESDEVSAGEACSDAECEPESEDELRFWTRG